MPTQAQRALAKKNGICRDCLRFKAKPGRRRCGGCAAAQVRRSRIRLRRKTHGLLGEFLPPGRPVHRREIDCLPSSL